MRIFHIATAADWQRAQADGAYTTSTRGRSLEEEGFLHASHREQVAGVFTRYYRDAGEPLVLLTIETDRLGVPWREEQVGEEAYPHIYGPLQPSAVVGVQPLNRRGGTDSFSALFYKEMMLRATLGIAVMVLTVLVATAFGHGEPGRASIIGAGVGFAVGIALTVLVLKRRRR